MKLLHKDLRAGSMKVQLETLDDLWTLRNLVQKGDLVTADTYRSAEAADDKIRSQKAEKKPMRIGVRAESVEWHDFDDHLRVLGTIETGPQDHGRHHTLVLRDDPTNKVEIVKRNGILPLHLTQISDAVAASRKPQVILLAIDDTEAQFGLLKGYGLQLLGSLPATGFGKRFGASGKAKELFYQEVVKSLTAIRTDGEAPLVVVGPGWWRTEFLEFAQAKAPAIVAGAITEGTSQGGRGGVQEALRRGVVARVSKDHRVQQDTDRVHELMARMAAGKNMAAYGPAEVREAVDAGACEVLMVADDLVRSGDHDGLLQAASDAAAHIHIVATSHDAGAQLLQLGGLGALLRFAYP